MEGYREVNKDIGPTKVHRITIVALIVLVFSLFLAVIVLCIAFAAEIIKLKTYYFV